MRETNKQFPELYGRSGNGSIHKWLVWTEGSWIFTEFGLIDGKLQTAKKQAEAKSLGRSNETTPEEQAVFEARSMWNLKIDKGYKTTEKEAKEGTVFLPMLAKEFDKHGKKIKYPCSIQPKLDGLRCMAFWDGDELRMISRRGKDFDLPHLSKELMATLPESLVLDGELYVHGESFQTITSWIKRSQSGTKQIRFNVYDCFRRGNPQAPYEERRRLLEDWTNTNEPDFVNFVETHIIHTEDEVYEKQSQFCEQGYEGAIVRDHSGPYKLKHRSDKLLKVKSFQDDEFRVINWERGKGRFLNCAIWHCLVRENVEFKVVLKGTMEQRKEMLENANSYIGQWLKVKYFGLTEEGKPRFPVGLGFRLPEDM